MPPLALLDSDLSEDAIRQIVECAFSKYGSIARWSSGMCGTIYFFDQGENVRPRFIAAKIPRTPKGDGKERNRRFLREMEIQHRTYHHEFVCYPFDYDIVHDTPVGLYRCADGDLAGWIQEDGYSDVSRLATLSYLATALAHCRSRGVLCHQDLKPQNVLMRNYRHDFSGLPDEDVFNVPLLADFGLANMWFDDQRPDGALPYMAPEQWLSEKADGASDVFSLGVIIFEVMSRGMHPIGERVVDWWPRPCPGNSKKWLHNNFWVRWAKCGCRIDSVASLSEDVSKIVHDCLSVDPADRPSLDQIQARLLQAIQQLDERAYQQALFRIGWANCQSRTTEDWTFRNQRLERLLKVICEDGASITA